MEELRRGVSGTDVRLTTEGADSDGVLIQRDQVVAEAAVHVVRAVELGRMWAREERYKRTGQ